MPSEAVSEDGNADFGVEYDDVSGSNDAGDPIKPTSLFDLDIG